MDFVYEMCRKEGDGTPHYVNPFKITINDFKKSNYQSRVQ